MARAKKQITARASNNHLQRRWRDYGYNTKLEDIDASKIPEDELVELVKFVKKELLERWKKYSLESTKHNILKIREVFDIEREVEQLHNAMNIIIQHLEVVSDALKEENIHLDKRKRIVSEAITTISLAKKFLKARNK